MESSLPKWWFHWNSEWTSLWPMQKLLLEMALMSTFHHCCSLLKWLFVFLFLVSHTLALGENCIHYYIYLDIVITDSIKLQATYSLPELVNVPDQVLNEWMNEWMSTYGRKHSREKAGVTLVSVLASLIILSPCRNDSPPNSETICHLCQ